MMVADSPRHSRLLWTLIALQVLAGIGVMLINSLIAFGYDPPANPAPGPRLPQISHMWFFGLLFYLFAAALLSRAKWVSVLGIVVYGIAALVSTGLGMYAAVFAFIFGAAAEEPPVGPESMAAGIAQVLAWLLLIAFAVVAVFSITNVVLLFLWRRRTIETPRTLFSRQAVVLLAVGVCLSVVTTVSQKATSNRVEAFVEERDREFAHSNSVVALAFGPRGITLASASTAHEIHIWYVSSGRPLEVIGTRAPVHCLAWLPDRKKLYAGCTGFNTPTNDGELLVIDPGKGIESRQRIPQSVACLDVSPDGKRLALGLTCTLNKEKDVTAEIYDTETMELLARVGDTAVVRSIQFSDDGSTLVVGRNDGLYFWDLPIQSGDEPSRVIDCGDRVESSHLSRDGSKLRVQTYSGRFLAYSVPDFAKPDIAETEIRELRGQYFSRMAIDPSETRIVTGSSEPVRAFDLATTELIWETDENENVSSLDISPDGQRLAVGSFRRIRIYDLQSGKLLRTCDFLNR